MSTMAGFHALAIVLLMSAACSAQLFGKADSLVSGLQLPCPVDKAMPKFELDKVSNTYLVHRP